MQHYEFPSINHLDDVLPHIVGRSEFNVNQRDGFKVVDYAYVTPDTFPPIPVEAGPERDTAIMRRECRGLLFNDNGDILSRRLHKFMNIGEREEYLPVNLDFSKPHDILDKLDGSLISSYMDPLEHIKWVSENSTTHFVGKVFWGTMYGNTEVASGAEKFVQESNFDYETFARNCMDDGWTPIFEWCSLGNRIVIRHDQSKLVLTAIRHINTGCYKTYNDMVEMARIYNIPVVKSFGKVTGRGDKFINKAREEEGIEGYVVRFHDGHSVKLKCDWYVRFHNAVENLVHEKSAWKIILHDDVDDVIPVLMEQDKDHLLEFQINLTDAMVSVSGVIEGEVSRMYELSVGDQKKYAELVKSNNTLIGPMKAMAFKMRSSGINAIDLVRDFAMKSTSSMSKIEEARKVIKVNPW